ncbi:MAG: exosortase A [Gammaproteobacteria bacterium]|nr:exosortase A [Gammaproteobacteria bacterium]
MTLPFTAADADTRVPTVPGEWRQALLVLALLLGASLGLYYSSYADLVATWWRSRTFNHCFLILPISLYLIHELYPALRLMRPRPSLLALPPLLLASLLGGLGLAADVMSVQHFAAVALWPLCAWAVLGDALARRMAFPFAYLLFAVPVGEGLVPDLQDLTANAAVTLLQWSGIPVLLEGRYITIPSGDFVVAEACSGISYLIASLALGALYAYMQYKSPWRRLGFMLLALIVPLAANGVRAYGIILLAHVSNMQLAVGVDHLIYGWLFFGLVLALMFWLGSFFRESAPLDLRPPASLAPPSPPRRSAALLLASLLSLSSGWLLAAWVTGAPVQSPAQVRLPAAAGEWQGPSLSEDLLAGAHPGAQRLQGVYESAAGVVHLDLAYYARETQGQELVSSRNRVFDAERWHRIGESRRQIGTHGLEVQVLRLRALGGPYAGTEFLVYSWYDVAGRRSASAAETKLLQLWGRISRQAGGQARFSIAAAIPNRRRDSERLLDDFLLSLDPPLSQLTRQP